MSDVQPIPNAEIVDINELHPAEYNPRTIGDSEMRALKQSLTHDPEFLKVRPIVANSSPERYGTVFIGAQRLRAAKELGWTHIPVIWVAVDVDKEKAWNLKDNKHQGEFDLELLQPLVLDLHNSSFNMDTLGWTPDELTGLMAPPEVSDPTNEAAVGKKQKEVECPTCHHKFMV